MFYKTDVVIVGSGLAGLYTALNLPEDWHITMISSHEDNSSLAQGGVASCVTKEDTFEVHMNDTLTAGHYSNDREAVSYLVENGPDQIRTLLQMGVPFDRNEAGSVNTTLEGGHSHRRILHVHGDQTGKGIMETLRTLASERPNIHQLNKSKLVELVTEEGKVTGIAYMKGHRIRQLKSGYTILATGGLGDLYAHTTNKSGTIGTGIALAHQVGAVCKDLRYIQFHPTALYTKNTDSPFLISEALRGEGAYLLDEGEVRFMNTYDHRLELAPRDIVAKAIYDVLRTQTRPYVYLDTRHMNPEFFHQRFPGITKHLRCQGIEPCIDLIPVVPVAHYTIGGIQVDLKGRTTIDGLYACGETSCTGVHGANRLASNSLLECLVFGKSIADHLSTIGKNDPLSSDLSQENPSSGFRYTQPDIHMVKRIQQSMTAVAGIQRTCKECRKLLRDFKSLSQYYQKQRSKDWGALYIHTMLYNSILVLEDALNHTSKGCHTIDTRKCDISSHRERTYNASTYEHTTA